MNDQPANTDRMLQYLDALLDDPQAASPPDLSAADVDFVRVLLRLYPVPAQPGERRRRVWQQVIAHAIARRSAVSTPLTKNGRQTIEELEMVTYPVQVSARPHPVRGAWIVGLAAAAVLVVAITLLLAYVNDTPPERGANSGAGVITLSPQASGTVLPPTSTPFVTTATPVQPDIAPPSPVPGVPNVDVTAEVITATPFPMEATILPPTVFRGSPVPVVPNMVVTAEMPPTAVPVPLLPPDAAQVLAFAPGKIAALAWSPDGQFLAAAYADRIDLLNIHDPAGPAAELQQAGALALAFSPDSRWLASAHQDGAVRLWDPLFSQGAPVATLDVTQTPLVKVSFSPDGTYLILESENGAIFIWSLSAAGPTLINIPLRAGDPVYLWGCISTFYGGTPPQSRPLDAYTIVSAPDVHDGIDLAARDGTPVLSAGSGTVVFAGWNDTGYGYTIVIAHGDIFSLYAHLSKVGVECGQKVDAGELIGAVGATGNASGPVLHFEIRDAAWTPLDPNEYIAF